MTVIDEEQWRYEESRVASEKPKRPFCRWFRSFHPRAFWLSKGLGAEMCLNGLCSVGLQHEEFFFWASSGRGVIILPISASKQSRKYTPKYILSNHLGKSHLPKPS